MRSRLFFVFILPIFFLSQAQAGFSGTLFGSYLTDNFSETNSSTDSKTFYGALLMASLDSKDRFYVGWSYSIASSTTTRTGVNDVFTSTDTGPAFSWWFGKNRQFNLAAAYNVVSSATFDQTGQTQKQWQGTSYWAAAGVEIEFWKNLHLGGRLLYYGTSYSDQRVGNAASDVSVNRTWVMPILTLSYRK